MRLHDGDLIKLAEDENATRVELVRTPGRGIAWRMYDRFGRGILLTHEQAVAFLPILEESLNGDYGVPNEV